MRFSPPTPPGRRLHRPSARPRNPARRDPRRHRELRRSERALHDVRQPEIVGHRELRQRCQPAARLPGRVRRDHRALREPRREPTGHRAASGLIRQPPTHRAESAHHERTTRSPRPRRGRHQRDRPRGPRARLGVLPRWHRRVRAGHRPRSAAAVRTDVGLPTRRRNHRNPAHHQRPHRRRLRRRRIRPTVHSPRRAGQRWPPPRSRQRHRRTHPIRSARCKDTPLRRRLNGVITAGAEALLITHYAKIVLSQSYRRSFRVAVAAITQAAEELPCRTR